MNLTSIGNINSYLKTLKMTQTWKQNAANPFHRIASKSGAMGSERAGQSSGISGDDRLTGIKTKLLSGKKLSVSDMEYLREKYPQTYDEVVQMERDHHEYEKGLRRCKTKSDARALHMNKMAAAISSLKGGAVSAEVAIAKLAKMAESYGALAGSARYSKLAETHLELAQAAKAEQSTQFSARQNKAKEAVEQRLRDRASAREDRVVLTGQADDLRPTGHPSPPDESGAGKAAQPEAPVAALDADSVPVTTDTSGPSAPKHEIDRQHVQAAEAGVRSKGSHRRFDHRA